MKGMKRAVRRHHIARLKNVRRHYFAFPNSDLEPAEAAVFLGRLVHTSCVCSCWMCGNPRRLKELTVQEMINNQILTEQLKSLCFNITESG